MKHGIGTWILTIPTIGGMIAVGAFIVLRVWEVVS